MPDMDIQKLNSLYNDAEEVDRSIFAEMRSNILLVSGDHYSKRDNKTWNNIRRSSRASFADKKLRLTKNHMHRIQRGYKTMLLSESPDVTILPKHDTDLQDKKDSELNKSVWEDFKDRHKFKQLLHDFVSDYTTIGEVCVKAFWNPDKGKLVGYEQLVDEDGEPVFEQIPDPNTGELVEVPMPDKDMPVFSGDYDIELIHGFNLLIESGTEDINREVDRAWIVRKMVNTKELQSKYKDDDEKVEGITESSKRTYVVFDVHKGTYHKKKGETLVREFYWKPSKMYPKGYYIYCTDTVILEEGELPLGIFPLKWCGFDKYQTSPRGRSILKIARPYQAEINRASSSMATHQITMGDDKLIYSSGSKLAPGALLPGVRGISVTGGQPPTVIPGRSGAQYIDYVEQNKSELYEVVELFDMKVVDSSGQIDPYALLFKSATQRRLFSPYIDRFSLFLTEFAELILTIARAYLPDDALISAVGKREMINIQEFRDTDPISYHIKIQPGSETVDTLIGRHMTFTQTLQYVGKQLDPKSIGKILKNMPYGNIDDSLDELMIDSENAENEMLAIERGERVVASPHADSGYMLKRLNHRMKKPDFRYLPPEVQFGYNQLVQQYEQIVQAAAQAEIAAKNEFIPVDGALVTCDIYVEDPKNPENQAKRAKIPQRALEWLMDRMEQQGVTLERIEQMDEKSKLDLVRSLQQQPSMGAGGQPPMNMNFG